MSESEAERKLNNGFQKWIIYLTALLTVAACVGIVFVLIYRFHDAASADTQRAQIANTECARQVASDYEDKRDDIFAALNNRGTIAEAVDAFIAFKEGPDGQPESRADRTKRMCPSPIP